MGILTLISEDVIAALSLFPPDLSATLAQFAPQPQWDNYVSGRFKETKDRDSSQLGGGKPSLGSTPRMSGGLGAGGLATVAVDEADGVGLSGGGGTLNKNVASSVAAIGASPTSASEGRPQNVVFASFNEDEDEEDDFARRRGQDNQSDEASLNERNFLLTTLILVEINHVTVFELPYSANTRHLKRSICFASFI